ncbi:STAS domain-containing protein [Deltaproteobacteria bacterium TL4]
MFLDHEEMDGYAIVTMDGDLLSEQTAMVKAYLLELLNQNVEHGILLDMRKVGFLNSSGVGMLVSFNRYLMDRNMKLGMYNLNKRNRDIVNITHLDLILNIFSTREEALSQG